MRAMSEKLALMDNPLKNELLSDKIAGDEGNYEWSVRFDKTHRDQITPVDRLGYIGITQYKDGGEIERVILSPNQVWELKKFIEKLHPLEGQ